MPDYIIVTDVTVADLIHYRFDCIHAPAREPKLLNPLINFVFLLLKAKFHYAIWFEGAANQLRTS